ncbi:MAG: ACT domain-containing protein [Coriobacteriales bacterium]
MKLLFCEFALLCLVYLLPAYNLLPVFGKVPGPRERSCASPTQFEDTAVTILLAADMRASLLEGFMELKKLDYDLTVCKADSLADIDLTTDFFFVAQTDEELSLVCKTEDTPAQTTDRDDGWRGFRIQGVLDFSLIGILSKLSGILAENNIGIFAVSTFNTDYILVKEENFEKALGVLSAEGYTVR